ncbi:MAG: helix-turn-helix domain-containing protein [Alkalibacterium sp.]|nr:helix-turn-helix domain-containing protein [Alkalibacterium sp.]
MTEKTVTQPVRAQKTGSSKSSAEETVDSFKEGQSIEEIADTRNLSPVTIVNHLSKWIEKGNDLKIHRYSGLA